jgi:hypothetical protein
MASGGGSGLDKKAIEKLKEELQDYKSKLEFSNKVKSNNL